jgi:hypothetical protein
MIDSATPISMLVDKIEEYSNSTVELFKMKAINKASDILSTVMSKIVIIMTVTLSILITSVGLALWLGSFFGHTFLGFFIIGGSYAFIALLFAFFSNKVLKKPINNALISQMRKQK